TPAPTCAGQGYTGTFPACNCPESYQTYQGADLTRNTAGTCVGSPPPAACPTGQSLTGYGAQCCPTGDTGNGTACYAPPPATCPSDTYGTYPACQPIPACSAVVGAYWGGPAAGCECPAGRPGTYPTCAPAPCPAGDTGTPPNCVPPPACNAVPGGYFGGTACECPAGMVGNYPQCIDQSSVTLTLSGPSLDPETVEDNGPGASPAAQSAVLTWAISSNVPGDVPLCYVDGGNVPAQSPTSVGGYSALQDGPQIVTVDCVDEWNVRVSGSVTLTVVPPPAAPPDQFTDFANPDGTNTLNWYTYSVAGCYVFESDSRGVIVNQQLAGGGGTSGSATTSVLFPGDSYTFTLECGGAPDPSVSSITVSP
ncbi:MAG: hypothetical protein ACRETL_16910, partial [Gammaproteobacteria bacterium]